MSVFGVDPDVPLDRASKQITEKKNAACRSGMKEGQKQSSAKRHMFKSFGVCEGRVAQVDG